MRLGFSQEDQLVKEKRESKAAGPTIPCTSNGRKQPTACGQGHEPGNEQLAMKTSGTDAQCLRCKFSCLQVVQACRVLQEMIITMAVALS